MRILKLWPMAALLMVALGAGFGGGPSGERVAPDPPVDLSTVWINSADGGVYTFDTGDSVWLGPVFEIPYDRQTTSVTGGLRFGGNGLISDTTTATRVGYWSADSLQLVRVDYFAYHAGTINCSTYVFSEAAVATKYAWGGAQGSIDYSDSSVVFPAQERVGVYIEPNASVPVNPNHPGVRLYVRKRVGQ